VVLAALGVGVLAGLLIPYRDLGLAFFLVLLAAGGTVWWAAKRRPGCGIGGWGFNSGLWVFPKWCRRSAWRTTSTFAPT